jgi:hypothetical protein
VASVANLLDAVGSRLSTVEPADAQVLRPIVFA